MDLLPSPTSPAYDPIEVPVLLGNPPAYKYDHQGFSDYPQRCGWDKEKILNGGFEGRDRKDVAAFLQSWLYFAASVELLASFGHENSTWDVENALISTSTSGEQVIRNAPLREAADKCREDFTLYEMIRTHRLVLPEELGAKIVEERKESTKRGVDITLDEVRTCL
jgi:hypothetical protein